MNELIVKGPDLYVLDSDQSADSLDAQNNFWSRNGIYHGDVDSILTYVDPDSALVRVWNPLQQNYGQPTCSPGTTARARPGVAVVDDAGRRPGGMARLSEEALRTELISTGPNPFAWSTEVRFSVANGTTDPVRVEIYDVTGRLVRRLVDGFVEPGTYRVSWLGRDEHGSRTAAGIYFLRMKTGSYIQVRKLVSLH